MCVAIQQEAPITLDDLNSVQVTRDELIKWFEVPSLKPKLMGLFVRVNIGFNEKKKQPIYRVADIRGIIRD